MTSLQNLRIAIVHDWLTVWGGAERVLACLIELFPGADIYSLVDTLVPADRHHLRGKTPITSALQNYSFVRNRYRHALPIMPILVEQFDLSRYDLVISSSHAVAKGVITGPDQLHICYCYSPMRYAWDLQHLYLKEAGVDRGIKGIASRLILHYSRIWDLRTANNVDLFISISGYIRKRIQKVYRRKSLVIYPPVDTDYFQYYGDNQDFYLTVGRMVPYKRVDMIVEAFSRLPNEKLVVIGDGPQSKKIQAAAGGNVTLLGFQSNQVVLDYMQRAKAFIFAAEEDFGITPLEAQCCGTPVIAFGKGGSLETIQPGVSGDFFPDQTVDSLVLAISAFRETKYDPMKVRQNAMRFETSAFKRAIANTIEQAYDAHTSGRIVEEAIFPGSEHR